MSIVYFKGEKIPHRHRRIWDPAIPAGTRGFWVCPREKVFRLRGTQERVKAGIKDSQIYPCGEELYLVVVDPPIRFAQRGTQQESGRSCQLRGCAIGRGVFLPKEDPRYDEVLKIIMSYVWNEHDIDFYR